MWYGVVRLLRYMMVVLYTVVWYIIVHLYSMSVWQGMLYAAMWYSGVCCDVVQHGRLSFECGLVSSGWYGVSCWLHAINFCCCLCLVQARRA